MAFACSFANTKIKIAIIEKLPEKIVKNPKIDGREIALTHHSSNILKDLKVWKKIPNNAISKIKEARILDGNSSYFLDFKNREIQKECLGYLVPNYLIKKHLYKRMKNIQNITLIDGVECLSINTDEKLYSTVSLSNGKNIKTSSKKSIEDCYTITTGLYLEDKIFRNGMENIIKKSKYYILGGDCYMYGMLSSGFVDIVVEDTLKAYDYMALVPVIQGAGGVITDKYNNLVTLDSDGSVLATANSLIHKQAINLINL